MKAIYTLFINEFIYCNAEVLDKRGTYRLLVMLMYCGGSVSDVDVNKLDVLK